MKNKNKRIPIILVWNVLIISLSFYAQDFQSQKKLDEILTKAREYCEKLENAAFDFVCKEKIIEKIDMSRGDQVLSIVRNIPGSWGSNKRILTNSYVYDYQLIKKGWYVMETRTLLEENGKERHEKNAVLKTQMFYFRKPLFGPTGLLSRYWQERLDYSLLGEEPLNGEKVLVIEAVPKPSFTEEHLYGKIWIKKSDYSILKIEWVPESMQDYERIETVAKKYKGEPQITMITEFNIEKKGIRFPSKIFVEEAYITKKGKDIRSETTINYNEYKFFTVEFNVKY